MSVMREILKLRNWFTGKNDKEQVKELKETLPETPPKLQIKTIQDLKAATQINTFRDVKAFCEEIRKDLSIRKRLDGKTLQVDELRKKTDNRLYVEMGNLADKIDRLIESKK